MVGKTNARNTSQQAGQINRVQKRVTLASTGVYIVPVNTKARVTDILGVVDSLGADATYALAVIRSGAYVPISRFVGAVPPYNVTRASAVTMRAGDILTDIGDNGSKNGTFDISATIEEFGV